MNRFHSLKLVLVAALGALALGALTGLAFAKDHHTEKRHHHHGNDSTGTIQSFDSDTGRLVIVLPNEETVGGVVTRRTKIKCEDEHAPDISHRRHGESEPGDDHGGHGEEEPGDDHGADNSGPSGHDDNGVGANCTTSDLIVGAAVHKAELEVEHGQATFEEVELVG
jgi:hypothetical protein